MDERKKRVLQNRIAQTGAIAAFGLILACFLQKAIAVKGVGSFWNPSLIPMAIYCPLMYFLAWKAYSRIFSDLFDLDLAYVSRLDLLSYAPTLLLLQYFFLHAHTSGIFGQKLLELVFVLICALKAGQLIFLVFRRKRLSPAAALRLSTSALVLLMFVATLIFVRSYDYLLYKSIEPRLIVARTREVKIKEEVRQVLYSPSPYLPRTNRIEKRVTLPEKAQMAFGIGVARNSWFQSDTGVDFRILVSSRDGREVVYSKLLRPKINEQDRGWIDETVDLSKYSGQKVTLIFETSVPYSETESLKKILKSSFGYTNWINIGKYGTVVEAVWSAPRIFSENQEKGPNAILISFDTFGAAHMGCYGYRYDTTPNLDRFASEGILFKQCVSQSPWTLPAHASLLTAQNCSSHGVVTNDFRLSDSFTTLAEVFQGSGYRTAAITEGGNVSSIFGLGQGFEAYDNGITQDISRTFEKAFRWIEKKRGHKFFLFLHTYEAHAFYQKREPYYSRYSRGYRGLIRGNMPFLNRPKRWQFFLRPEDAQELNALYDSELSYIDAHFKMLTDKLESLGLAESTTVVVTSDHGEGFGEHNYFGHGNTLYNELLSVPLIVRDPGLPAGLVVDQAVRLIDVMPTLLALHRLPIPEGLDGVSLLPIIQRAQTEVPPAISEVDEPGYGPAKKSILDGEMKLIVTAENARTELYDLTRDPLERFNLSDAESRLADRMKDRLDAKLASFAKKKAQTIDLEKGPKQSTIDETTQKQLKALGYLN